MTDGPPDVVDGHAWELGGFAEGENLAECRRCGWVTNLKALDQLTRHQDGTTFKQVIVNREWAPVPACDEALVRSVLES